MGALGRWSRDVRSPSLRLHTPESSVAWPERTAELPIIPLREVRDPGVLQVSRSQSILHAPAGALTRLRRATKREETRQTACPFLEYRASNRRCLSATPSPVSIERQVRFCLTSEHQQCKYYRKAQGLPAVPPTQAAFYTAAAVMVVILIVLAGLN